MAEIILIVPRITTNLETITTIIIIMDGETTTIISSTDQVMGQIFQQARTKTQLCSWMFMVTMAIIISSDLQDRHHLTSTVETTIIHNLADQLVSSQVLKILGIIISPLWSLVQLELHGDNQVVLGLINNLTSVLIKTKVVCMAQIIKEEQIRMLT